MTDRLSKLSRSIDGSTVIVTGAASGMGRATAHLFADEGAKLALIDIDESALSRVADEIRTVSNNVMCLVVDLSDKFSIERAVSHVAEHYGDLDILINNAGFATPAAIDSEVFDDVWSRSLDVMATAQAWAIRAALPWLRQSNHPRVVNIASTEAYGATPQNSAYVAAKHASVGLTRAMAVDLGKEGITVNCVCPGPVHTGITQDIPEDAKQLFAARRTALRRYADPEEIAHATLSLSLPSASFITGATLVVDGGLTIRNA